MNRLFFRLTSSLVLITASVGCGDSGYLTPALLQHSEACAHLSCPTETSTDFSLSGRWVFENCKVNETDTGGSAGSCSGDYRVCAQQHPARYGLQLASASANLPSEYQPFYASTRGTLATGSFILYGTLAPETTGGLCRKLSDLVLTCQSQGGNGSTFQCEGFEHVRSDQCDGAATAGWSKYRTTLRRTADGTSCPGEITRPE
ncbi:hypothetical protein [Archangium sp.]|jgi:hypothetical protein|uniref:hypothetical protein n=1 Tax=Archangium sp. TaxID=1872627 RepID=UPI002ED8737E